MGVKKLDLQQLSSQKYDHFDKINGLHPWQEAVPEGYIFYNVRQRPNGKVIYFNFELAKEMGLISSDHGELINPDLEQKILQTFAIQIINEYDLIHKTSFPKSEIKPHPYMATRYLQLQHPSRTGKTSGDGRSIWNGIWKNQGKTWDLSSCGTGATALSPATANSKKFFRTGDPTISYGCGYAEVGDSLETAVFSQILHQNGTPTERSLCVVEFPNKLALNVRVSENLIRPSHLFNHLRQSNLPALQRGLDYYIDRQVDNQVFSLKKSTSKYDVALNYFSQTFAQMAAHFEAEYLFCWLAWDGDNILLDGKIIDYGSIRQLGLFHHKYRFDDVERWSTSITEQKIKAREIIQTLAQAIDYVKTGSKKPLTGFSHHPVIKLFNQEFAKQAQLNLLSRLGFEDSIQRQILIKNRKLVRDFQNIFTYFELALTKKGEEDVPDGVNTHAVYCMRNLLREFPKYISLKNSLLTPQKFISIAKSISALKKDVKITKHLTDKMQRFQLLYLQLINEAAQIEKRDARAILSQLILRSDSLNRYARVTGDGICHSVAYLISQRKKMTIPEFQILIKKFCLSQNRNPDIISNPLPLTQANEKIERALKSLSRIIKKYTEDL